jgi:dienelactone hydrolase
MVVIPKDFVNKPQGYPEDLPAEEVRRRFLRLLGPFKTPSVALEPRVTEEVELEGGVVRQRLEYSVEPSERVPAYHLFHRDLPADAPGVLSIHAHGGEEIFPVGKAFHCHPDPRNPMQYSYRAALAGFRVLAPDSLCFGERCTPYGHARFFFDETNTHAELTGRGKSLAWKSVWDNSRAVEVLQHLGASSIGCIGWSGGSTQSYILAAVNETVNAAACFFSFTTLRHQLYQYRGCHCLYHFIPGMIQAGIDWDQVVALTAPRKLFLAWGALDEGTPEPEYRAYVEAIRARCQNESLPPSVATLEDKERGHELTEAMLSSALTFLRESLS